jgi:hypothetical protein
VENATDNIESHDHQYSNMMHLNPLRWTGRPLGSRKEGAEIFAGFGPHSASAIWNGRPTAGGSSQGASEVVDVGVLGHDCQ